MKSHFTLFNAKMRALLLGAAVATMSAPAFAAETWLACEGTVVTKKGKEAGTSVAAATEAILLERSRCCGPRHSLQVAGT